MKVRSHSRPAPPLALAALLVTLVHAQLAQAQDGGLVFDWEAPAGCPSRDAVLSRLRTIVGKSLSRADRLRAQGRIEASSGRYRLSLKLRQGDAQSERVIESNSCSDLAGAAAIALGLLVRDEIAAQDAPSSDGRAGQGSEAHGGQPETTLPATLPSSKPDAPSSSSSELAERANRTSERSVRFLLRAPQIGIDVGPLPHPNPTFGLSGGVGIQALELSVGARLGLGQTVWADGTPAYGAEMTRAALELRAGYAIQSGRFSIVPSLLTALDLVRARGVGAEVTAQPRTTLVFAVGAAALARFRFAELLALVVSVGAQVETSRPHLVVDGLSEAAKLTPFAVTTSTGLEWSL